MKNLIKKYPKIDFKNITEKHIIYFCRDALNHKEKETKKEVFEKEILEIIKQKDWDWTVRDIDENTIIAYPIYNNSFKIVEYLIDNKRYDITKYDKNLSKDLSACITLLGEDMLNYILSKNPHIDYINEMASKAYDFVGYVSGKETKDFYIKIGDKLIENDNNLYNIISNYIENVKDFSNEQDIFIHILNTHSSSVEDKIRDLDKLIKDKGMEKTKGLRMSNLEKLLVIENWKNYHIMKNNIVINQDKSTSKVKI